MAALTVNTVVRTGLTNPTPAAAAAGGDTFVNDGKTMLRVVNAGGSICNVTVDALKNCDQGFDHNATVAVPATTGDVLIGPFPKSTFNGAGGVVSVSYDQVTSVTVAVISVAE